MACDGFVLKKFHQPKVTFSHPSLGIKKEVSSQLAHSTLPNSGVNHRVNWVTGADLAGASTAGQLQQHNLATRLCGGPHGVPALPRSSQIKEASRAESALSLIHCSMLLLQGGAREALRRSGEVKYEVHMWLLSASSIHPVKLHLHRLCEMHRLLQRSTD